MLRFAANLTFMFTELPFMGRFGAARKAGFNYVEFMFPYDFDLDEIENQLKQHKLKLILFNLPAGNWEAGDRGIALDPKRKSEFISGVENGIVAAQRFSMDKLNCLVGRIDEQVTNKLLWDNLVDNIGYAAEELGKHGMDLLVEPVNHFDVPGFYLNKTDQVLKLISEVNRSNVYLQYDVYHAEREGEDHRAILSNSFHKIRHIQIADNPGRHQPGTGVIDYKFLFAEIERLEYKGYIAMEYKPKPNTLESLEWINKFGYKL